MKKSYFYRLRSAYVFCSARLLQNCKTITPLLGKSLDRKLSLREKLAVKLHLISCRACTNYFKQIKFLRAALKQHEKNAVENDYLIFPASKKK